MSDDPATGMESAEENVSAGGKPAVNAGEPERVDVPTNAAAAGEAEAVAVPVAGTASDDDEVGEAGDGVSAVRQRGSNAYFRAMMDKNFLEYAAYVIKDRAIPDVDDGLKPVQRRILWVLHQIDDGRTHKAANVIGNAMHFHPHGDASIGDALVVLANKEYFIHKQGNFGNILTGSPAAAPRYIECSLSPLGRETLFSDEITELVDSYDGRSREPVVLPVKIPSLLMLGSDGIAVGMATRIMPHNFNELLQAQIATLRGEPFELFPDFLQGGLMDASEYLDGNGKITLRARIDIDGRELVIRELPATTTTESLIASIERAAEKNKIKISGIHDHTAQNVEIRIMPTRGYDPEKARQALYMYTDCSVSISVNLTVIRDRRPVQMSVTEVIHRNTEKLLLYLRRELELALERQEGLFHAKTLAQIFFENRIYKRIEECRTQEEEYAEVEAGLAPFLDRLRRELTREDIDRLLALPVRRISRFDIEKNQRELKEILDEMKRLRRHLAHLKEFAISYLEDLIAKYGAAYPRRTEIEHFDKIDRTKAALNNIKVGWDRRNGYVGTAVKSDDLVVCNEFDRFICTTKKGVYRVIPLPPEKLFVDKLYDFRRYDAETVFGIIYREKKSGKYYGKRSSIGGYILEKEYRLCPEGCQLELMTPRPDAIYLLTEQGARKAAVRELNLMELPNRTPRARGVLISSKALTKITHSRYLTEEELAAFAADSAAGEDGDEGEEAPERTSPAPEAAAAVEMKEVAAAEDAAPVPEAAAAVETKEVAAAEDAAPAPETAAAVEMKEVAAAEDAAPAPETTAAAEPEERQTQESAAPAPEAAAAASSARRRRRRTSGDEKKVVGEAPELLPPDAVAVAEKEPVKSSNRRRPPEKPVKKPVPTVSDEEEDFGIVQPEFGF